jgi:hypothetical protein
MFSKWWWPFSKEHQEVVEETRNEFQSQLQEALLRTDDLKAAAASMKRERMQRLESTQMIRPKLNSSTVR